MLRINLDKSKFVGKMTHVEFIRCDSCDRTQGNDLHWFHVTINYDSQESDYDICSKSCFFDFVKQL